MRKLELALVMVLALGVTGMFLAAQDADAHGAACGSACVDADNAGAADDLATCSEVMDEDPSDGICGCLRLPGHLPEGGEPVYEYTGDHLNAASISGFADQNGPNGCLEINEEAALSSNQETDRAACEATAGQACFDNGCADIDFDHEDCGGDADDSAI